MLHEIGVELGAALAARGCPIRVVDGPEGTKGTTHARERIVLERSGADAFAPARSQHGNPRAVCTRLVGGRLTIYVQSPAQGPWEHERRAEHVLDVVLAALHEVAARRRVALNLTSGTFLPLEDLEKSERRSGAVYALGFSIERAVVDRKWSGAARPEATVGGPGGVTIVSTDAITDPSHPTPETAC